MLKSEGFALIKIQKFFPENKIILRALKNGELVAMPVNQGLKRILDKMKTVPLTMRDFKINKLIKKVARKLKISKHLSNHCARKTFAVTMCAERGISVETCAKLMGITVEVCYKSYYRVSDTKIDKEVNLAWQEI